jgi:DNA polymerase-1
MKLLLIDGYSLLYRAFFSSPPFTTKDGTPTGALFGFSKMVLRLLDEMQPEYALVALDAHGPTFRHDNDATYKAGRQEMPDDLRRQTTLVREMLPGLSIPFYEHQGFEADDILGTVSCTAREAGLDVTIVTGDGDALQLVDDKVSVMLTRRGVSDLECYTPQAVRDRYGFDPQFVPDYKGLRGDASDNIPGVPGIGEKTACSLLAKHGSLDQIFEDLETVTPPRIRELLRANREVAFHSRQMARIVCDLPVEMSLEEFRYGLDEEKRRQADETVRRFEFKSLYGRYLEPEAAEEAPSYESHEVVLSVLEDEKSLHEWAASTSLVALLLDGDSAFLARDGEAKEWSGGLQVLAPWLQNEKQPKIVHDAKALKLDLASRGLEINGIVADTFLMGYLLEPTKQQHPLEALSRKYLGRELPGEMEVPKPKKKKADASLFEEEEAENPAVAQAREQHRQVVAHRAVAALDLRPVLCEELGKTSAQKLLDEMELPLVDVLVSMERAGMLLDRDLLRKIGAKLETDGARLQREIWDAVGEEFNIGSTKQLQTILYEKLQLSPGRTTKTGFSTDVHTLEALAEKHEAVRKILDYRGITKLKSTYIDALLAGMDEGCRVHTNLNQTGTVSGRLSSSNPNLQNVPIRTEQGRLIRRAFVAPPGHVLLAADYSQIELRLLAHITGDKTLVDAFNSGEDVHSRTAADLFHIPIEEVDKEMRRKAKMTNYAIAYGVSGFGLAKQLGSGTTAEASEFIKRYFVALPGVKKYIDDTLQDARAQGYVATLLGRRRPLPEITSPRAPERAAAERTAINHPIQGTSADAMKLAMLAVFRELNHRGLKTRMTMQVHDELVFEVPEDEVEEVAGLVGKLMREVPTQALGLRVPLEVDVEFGPNWDETHPVEDADEAEDAEVEQALAQSG